MRSLLELVERVSEENGGNDKVIGIYKHLSK
jgi:hypothetical protein